jgi:hypothetical protein
MFLQSIKDSNITLFEYHALVRNIRLKTREGLGEVQWLLELGHLQW